MSVYQSRRKESEVLYIQTSEQLLLHTYAMSNKVSTRFRKMLLDKMVELADDISTNCVCANDIYISKYTTKSDFELRKRYLMLVKNRSKALIFKINLFYKLMRKGNNFFKNKQDLEKKCDKWTKLANSVYEQVRRLMDSDKKRWNRYEKENKEITKQIKNSNIKRKQKKDEALKKQVEEHNKKIFDDLDDVIDSFDKLSKKNQI